MEETAVCSKGKAFCIRVFSVENIWGHVWVNVKHGVVVPHLGVLLSNITTMLKQKGEFVCIVLETKTSE